MTPTQLRIQRRIQAIVCRCCGKAGSNRIESLIDAPIHTMCIPKHWGKHAKGVNATRCKEFDNLITVKGD